MNREEILIAKVLTKQASQFDVKCWQFYRCYSLHFYRNLLPDAIASIGGLENLPEYTAKQQQARRDMWQQGYAF